MFLLNLGVNIIFFIFYLFIFLMVYGLLSCALVQMLGLAHGALNVQDPDVLTKYMECFKNLRVILS